MFGRGQNVQNRMRIDGQPEGLLIQDYVPLAESLDWKSGQQFWQESGSRAFLGEIVPFKITNDGNLSQKAAKVVFTQLLETDQQGRLEASIRVLELGVGIGLFARYFLDAFRSLCLAQEKDYYERLIYIATDWSEQMLEDLRRNEVLAPHDGHFKIQSADALLPEFGLTRVGEQFSQSQARCHAIFLNYLLDSLPAAIVRMQGETLEQLYLRPRVPREHSNRAVSNNPAGESVLDFEYRPVGPDAIPYADLAVQFVEQVGGCVVHNYGAMQCLDHAKSLLQEEGLILISDYGDPLFDEASQTYRHQRFGGAAVIGVNIPLLKFYCQQRTSYEWLEPSEENPHICVRLIGHDIAPATQTVFRDQFSREAFRWLYEPFHVARTWARERRVEAARSSFQEALRRQPRNWALMGEFAAFLTGPLQEHQLGLDMAEAGLAINPMSPDLWNTHGDCLFYSDRLAEAHHSYARAIQLNPDDVRACYNLSFTYDLRNDPTTALRVIAEGLAKDTQGKYRERLLHQQSAILSRLDHQSDRQEDVPSAQIQGDEEPWKGSLTEEEIVHLTGTRSHNALLDSPKEE